MKEGKRPPTQEELQESLRIERENEFNRKMEEYERKKQETQDRFDQFVAKQNKLNEETREKIEQELQA